MIARKYAIDNSAVCEKLLRFITLSNLTVRGSYTSSSVNLSRKYRDHAAKNGKFDSTHLCTYFYVDIYRTLKMYLLVYFVPYYTIIITHIVSYVSCRMNVLIDFVPIAIIKRHVDKFVTDILSMPIIIFVTLSICTF